MKSLVAETVPLGPETLMIWDHFSLKAQRRPNVVCQTCMNIQIRGPADKQYGQAIYS